MQRPGRARVPVDQAAIDAHSPGFGSSARTRGRSPMQLPAGTLYIPMDQPLKHWIQAVLGEDPYQPLNLFYDVAAVVVLAAARPERQRHTSLHAARRRRDDGDRRPRLGLGAGRPHARSYAFDHGLDAGLALATSCSTQGATVTRGAAAFDAAGKHFETGAALVDGASLAGSGVDLQELADKRQTPVSALPAIRCAVRDGEAEDRPLHRRRVPSPKNPRRRPTVRPIRATAARRPHGYRERCRYWQ